jgi:hypothetical protein
MKKRIVFLGVVLALLLVVSAASAANEVYFSQQTVYIPECGNATVDIRLNVTDDIDTWSTRVEFDSECVNITEVNFSGSITQANASGHHGDYIYLGGTNLTAMSGNELLLATLTVECNGSSSGPVDLGFAGEENVTRLIAGPPDGDPGDTPRVATMRSVTWVNGSAQSVGCGDVDYNGNVNAGDYFLLRAYVLGAPVTVYSWAADVDGEGNVNAGDYFLLRAYVLGAPVTLNCCGPS